MDKPYIICHMAVSLDGKVTGEFLEKEANSGLIEEYYRIHQEYGADGFLCGRVTMEEGFSSSLTEPVAYAGPVLEREDYVARQAPFYGVVVDPRGKLWWSRSYLSDPEEGYDGGHIIEILTHNVADAFLAHLRAQGVSYIFGGQDELDIPLVLEKLKRQFGIETLLLEGGGIVNGSFIQEDLIDELSLLIIPDIEYAEGAMPLFKTGLYQSAVNAAVSFQLKDIKRLKDNGLWLVYQKHLP